MHIPVTLDTKGLIRRRKDRDAEEEEAELASSSEDEFYDRTEEGRRKKRGKGGNAALDAASLYGKKVDVVARLPPCLDLSAFLTYHDRLDVVPMLPANSSKSRLMSLVELPSL